MKTCFAKSDLKIDIKELRTPADKRTRAYKKLVAATQAIKIPYYQFEDGIFTYLRFKDVGLFMTMQSRNIQKVFKRQASHYSCGFKGKNSRSY